MKSSLALLRQNPLSIFSMLIWIARGRANLKHRIAQCLELDVSRLPYRSVLVDFLNEQRKLGSLLELATASHRKYAQQVADYLGIFDHVLATDWHINLKASRKAKALSELLGHYNCDYIGDSRADLKVWAKCAGALLVDPGPGLVRRVRHLTDVKRIFPGDSRPNNR